MSHAKIEANPLEGLMPLDREVVEMLTLALHGHFPRFGKPRATERARAFCEAAWGDSERFEQTSLQNLARHVRNRNRILVSQTSRKVGGMVLEFTNSGRVVDPDQELDSRRNGTLPEGM